MQIICLFSSSRRLSVSVFYFFFQSIIPRVPFKQHNTKNYLAKQVPPWNAEYNMLCTYTAGIHTQVYRYMYQYDINTGTGHFGKFVTTSIPIPDTSVTSVRYPRYPYRTHPCNTPFGIQVLVNLEYLTVRQMLRSCCCFQDISIDPSEIQGRKRQTAMMARRAIVL